MVWRLRLSWVSFDHLCSVRFCFMAEVVLFVRTLSLVPPIARLSSLCHLQTRQHHSLRENVIIWTLNINWRYAHIYWNCFALIIKYIFSSNFPELSSKKFEQKVQKSFSRIDLWEFMLLKHIFLAHNNVKTFFIQVMSLIFDSVNSFYSLLYETI